MCLISPSPRCSWRSLYSCFFFSSRRRHTRLDCDWSSDVCSSDLRSERWPISVDASTEIGQRSLLVLSDGSRVTLNTASTVHADYTGRERRVTLTRGEADRKSVVEGKRVDLGGRRIIKKKKK